MTGAAGGGAEGGWDRTTLALMNLVMAATVRIHRPEPGYAPDGTGRGFLGSGFFIAPSWVLTCAHVAMQGEGREVDVVFRADRDSAVETSVTGTVVATLPEPGPGGPGPRPPVGWAAPDLALVRLLRPVDHACVYVTERPAAMLPGGTVHYVGWAASRGGQPAAVTGDCTVKGMFGGPADAEQQIRLGGDWLEPGMSGGPVVDLARGEVVGVLKSRLDGEQGGTAVGIERLRTMPVPGVTPGEPPDDPYQAVFHAHDRYHADRHNSPAGTERTWADTQSELPARAGRALSPKQRIDLLGRLAQFPPPVSTRGLLDLLDGLPDVHARDHRPAPRGWRDGLGALYEVRDGDGALELILRYCMAVIAADRPYGHPPATAAAQSLWEWVRRMADDHLSRTFRKELAVQWGAARHRPDEHRRPTAQPDVPARLRERPFVLLALELRGWEQGRYDWRIGVGDALGDFLPVAEDVRGTALADLPGRLAAPLTEAFRRCDDLEGPAVLQVAVGRSLLDLDVADWRLVPGDPPLGALRPVVVRRSDQPPMSEEWLKERKARWNRTGAAAMRAQTLDCDDGIMVRVPEADALRTLAYGTVPLLCHYGRDARPDAAAGFERLLSGGFGVALWRRRGGDGGAVCTEFHRRAAETVEGTRATEQLPYKVHELRKGVHAGRIETFWSDGLTLYYDDPHQPLPGTEQLLEAP